MNIPLRDDQNSKLERIRKEHMMLKRILVAFVMIIAMVSCNVTKAAEAPQTYLDEVDVVLNAGDVLYTIFSGMSLDDLRANFRGATQWTIVDGGEVGNIDPNVKSRWYYIYRNINEKDPVYELITIQTDDKNEHVWQYYVNFYTNSEKIARAMYNKATNENKIKYGMPDISHGKREGMFGDRRGGNFETFISYSLGTNVWKKQKIAMTGLNYFEGRTAERIALIHGLPVAVNYSIQMK